MSGAPAPAGGEPAVALSVVAPVYDELENLRPLYERVRTALEGGVSWELVLVDDGSRDGSAELIRDLALEDPRVRGVYFRRNSGQSAATVAGLLASRAPLVATLDADLQNDPADLPALLEALGDADAVVGYRVQRRDSWVRRASSRVANRVRNWVCGDDIRDTGCSLKIFRREALESVPRFNGMHRFLPTLLGYLGYRVLQHPVGHHPRTAGESKYGIGNRLGRGLADLFGVRWMRSRVIRLPLGPGPGPADGPPGER